MKTHDHFVFVHGTNGSGKSTLARVLIACAGGVVHADEIQHGKAKGGVISVTETRGFGLVGPYRTSCGGADSVHPYELVPRTIEVMMQGGYHAIFAEGLVTPGVELCKRIYTYGVQRGYTCDFILLDVPIETCTQHVLARRARKGNEKPYSNEHLIKKHRNAENWVRNLCAAKIPARKLPWKAAVNFCMNAFDLDAEHVKWNC